MLLKRHEGLFSHINLFHQVESESKANAHLSRFVHTKHNVAVLAETILHITYLHPGKHCEVTTNKMIINDSWDLKETSPSGKVAKANWIFLLIYWRLPKLWSSHQQKKSRLKESRWRITSQKLFWQHCRNQVRKGCPGMLNSKDVMNAYVHKRISVCYGGTFTHSSTELLRYIESSEDLTSVERMGDQLILVTHKSMKYIMSIIRSAYEIIFSLCQSEHSGTTESSKKPTVTGAMTCGYNVAQSGRGGC